MEGCLRLLLVGIVALLAAFVVGGGVCFGGIMLSEMSMSSSFQWLEDLGIIVAWGAWPVGLLVFVAVMIKLSGKRPAEDEPNASQDQPPQE